MIRISANIIHLYKNYSFVIFTCPLENILTINIDVLARNNKIQKNTKKRGNRNDAFGRFDQEEEYEHFTNKDTTEQEKYVGCAPKLRQYCLVVCTW